MATNTTPHRVYLWLTRAVPSDRYEVIARGGTWVSTARTLDEATRIGEALSPRGHQVVDRVTRIRTWRY